ncbi:rhomboid-like protein 5 [Quercus suber]|uniref:RHOMBOID-like protein n=1 Tax=Quercus suber TaxID=58331 RepID=A0AAW0JJW1_QUESU
MDAREFSLASMLNVLFVMPVNWEQISFEIGISGALFDLLEAMVSELLANWIIFVKKVLTPKYSVSKLVTLMLIIAINCPLRFLPHVDNSAQFEGFLSGFPLGFILLTRPQFRYLEEIWQICYGYGCIELFNDKKSYSCVVCLSEASIN